MSKPIKTVAVLGKRGRKAVKPLTEKLLSWASENNLEIFLDSDLKEHKLKTSATYRDTPTLCGGVDLLFVLGGDGTLLSGARAAVQYGTPVLGVNLGGLGFLTEIAPDELSNILPAALKGELCYDRRQLFCVQHLRKGKVLNKWVVINDVVIHKGALARIISLSAAVNDQPVNLYRADGLIVATPTGSTAYSLSAGGPIVEPGLECMVVTPICPHTLTHRPLLLRSFHKLSIRLEVSNGTVYLTLDGQQADEVEEGDEVLVEPFEKRLDLVKSPSKSFFEILSTKLKWGQR